MNSKKFISPEVVRNNGIKLAQRILQDGFIPDVIYVSLRGGAALGNIISEYYKLIPRERSVFYAAVVARSYIGFAKQQEISIDGWTYNPEYLRQDDKVLLVDDIFDSGHTIDYLIKIILSKGIPRKNLKVAVHDYKIRTYCENMVSVTPDYFCNKYIVNSEQEEIWIHYLSHEVEGLTLDELEHNYSEKETKEILQKIIHNDPVESSSHD